MSSEQLRQLLSEIDVGGSQTLTSVARDGNCGERQFLQKKLRAREALSPGAFFRLTLLPGHLADGVRMVVRQSELFASLQDSLAANQIPTSVTHFDNCLPFLGEGWTLENLSQGRARVKKSCLLTSEVARYH